MKACIVKSLKKIRADLKSFRIKNPDEKWTKNLAGACATSSFLVKELLAKHGISSKIYYSSLKTDFESGHVWVETDSYLIDLTYSQFCRGRRATFIVKKNSQDYFRFRNKFTRPLLKNNLKDFKHWSKDQAPEKCLKRMKKAGFIKESKLAA